MRIMWIIFILISTFLIELTPKPSYGGDARADLPTIDSQSVDPDSITTANQFMKDLMVSLVGRSLQVRFKIVGGQKMNFRDHVGLNTTFEMTAPIFIKLYDPAAEAEMDPNFKPIAKTGDENKKLAVQIRTVEDDSIEENQMRLEVSFFENQEPTYLNFDISMGVFDNPIALRVYSLSGIFNFPTEVGQSMTVKDGRCRAEQKIADWKIKSESWKQVDCEYSYLYRHQNPNLSEQERQQILDDIKKESVEMGEPQFELSYNSCGKEQC